MKKITLFFCLQLSFLLLGAQTILPLTDNMDIMSNTMLKIAPGNYNLTDPGSDGLIRINNAQNIVIDGDSVMANGQNYGGYAIKINNSDHIIIKNFNLVNHFKYALYITNSSYILVDSCYFSYNKVDSAGWIDVWAGYTAALGGGVLCYQCDSVEIRNSIMNMQNDGVALYNSKNIRIHHNDFNWNTSYGIRMFFTDSSHIHHNLASNINRPLTNPSDCAALLMIVSNENLVDHNDLSFSGDGVFLGQYQHSSTPNNNIFLYNECSGSPHNAIEATFADGNIYKYNICNYSHYGMWLGYSFNSIVDSNEIKYNHYSGIAVDRGYNNSITNNRIIGNPNGIELWEGSPISGYQNQTSHHYQIRNNNISRNTEGIHAVATENLIAEFNSFDRNHTGLYLNGLSDQDSIRLNQFVQSTLFDIHNNSPSAIHATPNDFYFNDTSYISGKIFDKHENQTLGIVSWQPFVASHTPVYQAVPNAELSEPGSLWIPYTETCGWMGIPLPLQIEWDSVTKQAGAASVHFTTGTGWYNALGYRPGGDSFPHWDLSNYGYLSFWIKSNNDNAGAFQYFHVRIGNAKGGYYRYNSTGTVLNQSLGQWVNYVVPLFGSSQWPRTFSGQVSLSDINYVEVYTDTYDVGYDLWLDGVRFLLATDVPASTSVKADFSIYPNPSAGSAFISVNMPFPGNISISVNGIDGKTIMEMDLGRVDAGNHVITIAGDTLDNGIYMVRVVAGDVVLCRKLAVVR